MTNTSPCIDTAAAADFVPPPWPGATTSHQGRQLTAKRRQEFSPSATSVGAKLRPVCPYSEGLSSERPPQMYTCSPCFFGVHLAGGDSAGHWWTSVPL
ncbi:hypothetical protein BaRGS_00008463 [Batillaria attramentaria]|uniref:Uncharacterized protein n=1 Tax=Batillaria attramentaria TaxID=370345 RepID=A0ABD0LL73_9CAEN